MKNKTCLVYCFLLFLLSSSNLYAQSGNYSVSNIAPELLVDAHTVIRYEKREIDIPSVSKAVLKHNRVVTLLSNDSGASELVIYYNSFNKVGKVKGKIYDARGKVVRELRKSDFKDYSAVGNSAMYGDSRVLHLEVSHSDYPYTIEFEYKKTYKRIMFYPDWFIQNFGISVENATLVVNAFNENQLGYKVQNIELDPIVEKDGNKIKYTWKVKNKVAIKSEPYAPSYMKIIPAVLLTPKSFKLGEYSGSMDSWKSYGLFRNKLNEGRDVLPAEMKKKVQELVANVKTDREKIDILYKYLQKNTRYVGVQLGVGGWQTFSAEYVYENQYGDCKALTNYMKSILKEAEIIAYPVLIGAGRPDDWYEEEYIYASFGHVILNVPSEDYWLECTSSTKPPNYLGSFNEDRTALRFSETGGELVKTPEYKAEQNQEKNKATITVSATGDAHIKNEILYTGTQQEAYRMNKFKLSQEDLEKEFLENEDFPSFSINKYEVTVSDTKPEVTETYDIDIKRYATKGGKRLFVPLNLINAATNVPASTESRVHPLDLTWDIFDEDQTIFIIPGSFKVESMPDSTFTLETDFGFYKVDITVEGNQLIYTRKLKLNSGEFPAERYEDYRNFRKEIGTRDSAKIVLVKRQA